MINWLSDNTIWVLLALGSGYIGSMIYRGWIETERVAKEAFEAELKRKEALVWQWKELERVHLKSMNKIADLNVFGGKMEINYDGLVELRLTSEEGLNCVVAFNRLVTDGNFLVILTDDAGLYHLHRYFPIGNKWHVKMDGQQPLINTWKWLNNPNALTGKGK